MQLHIFLEPVKKLWKQKPECSRSMWALAAGVRHARESQASRVCWSVGSKSEWLCYRRRHFHWHHFRWRRRQSAPKSAPQLVSAAETVSSSSSSATFSIFNSNFSQKTVRTANKQKKNERKKKNITHNNEFRDSEKQKNSLINKILKT